MNIQQGDEVKVVVTDQTHFWGEVIHKPVYQGDSWIIEGADARGVKETYALNQFQFILKRGE